MSRTRGPLRARDPEKFAALFWEKVLKIEDGCWLWQGATFVSGYPKINSCGKMLRGNRVAFELSKGSIPQGLDVLHTCDTPLCVKPDHLYAGTHKQNMKDMSDRGRAVGRKRISDETIKAMRDSAESVMVLAKLYGISPSYVSRLVRGKRRAA